MEEIEIQAHNEWESGNLQKAYELFAKCAALGSESCMVNLGYFHDEGIGTDKNKVLAMYWYKKAYRLGSCSGASNIAILYKEQGRFRNTFQWYQRAALLQDGDAELELAKLCISGIGTRKSLDRAMRHLQNAVASEYITPAGKEGAEEIMSRLKHGL